MSLCKKKKRYHGRVAGQRREHRASAHYLGLCDGNGDGEEAVQSRLGELHRMLNNRKGSLSATHKKNAEANDRAYDMNQKTIQAPDALAEEYGTFEASMKKVTFEHEEGGVLYAVASEARWPASEQGALRTR